MAVLVVNSGVNAFQPSIIGGLGATPKIFPALNYPNPGVGGAGNSGYNGSVLNGNVIAASPSTTPLTCVIPATGQFEQQRFTVNASGKIFIHGTSPTLIWNMWNGTSMTYTSDGTALLTMSAFSGLTTNAWYPWTWSSVFQGDTSSGILQAVSSTLWVDNATAGTITLTGATGINFTASGPVNVVSPGYTTANNAALNLIISIEFTVTDALNKGYCSQFVVEA